VIERAIPRTGEPLPVVGLGTWQTFDVSPGEYESRARVLQRFVALGGRVVDSSPMYGRSETAVGDLAHQLRLHDRLFLATKVWIQGQQAGRAQMDDSLRKLGVSRIDLMQVHNLLDVEAHLATLAEWKAQGRVRYLGVTHYTVDSHRQLETFVQRGDVDFVQFNYSLAVRAAERRLLPMAAEHGVATVINRPFDNGAIFSAAARKRLPPIAAELNCRNWAQLFVKYLVSHPAVTCIIPATTDVEHLEANMRAAEPPLADDKMRATIVRAWEA
jgi:diketogulonate reductase-like aldo/keto reductase